MSDPTDFDIKHVVRVTSSRMGTGEFDEHTRRHDLRVDDGWHALGLGLFLAEDDAGNQRTFGVRYNGDFEGYTGIVEDPIEGAAAYPEGNRVPDWEYVIDRPGWPDD